MTAKHLVAALAVATLLIAATGAEAKGIKVKSPSSSGAAVAATTTTRDSEPAFNAETIKKTKNANPVTESSGTSVSVSPRLRGSSSSPAPNAVSAVNNAAAPVRAAAPALEEEAKRKRAEELAALQRKLDEETKARQSEVQRQKAAAAEAERKGLEQQEEQRRAAEAKQREARRAMHAAAPPTCVIERAVTDDDLGKCRGRQSRADPCARRSTARPGHASPATGTARARPHLIRARGGDKVSVPEGGAKPAAATTRRHPVLHERIPNLEKLVEPDRVHRLCYTDPDVFELEIRNIFEKCWIYAGHESQVKNPGDFWTFQIGRQPMVMIRGERGAIHVLYNRCPHRGVQVCGARHGNAGDALTCSYHAWRFKYDGTVESLPLPRGYEGTTFTEYDCNMKRAPRVESYRGFVFASLATDGPSLQAWLGPAKVAFDDICDRSPVGEVEVVMNCYRVIQRSNWKFFMENQLDAVHPSVTHESTGRAASEVEFEIHRRTGEKPLHYHMLSAFTIPFDKWDTLETYGYPYGHTILGGYMGLRPQDPDTLEHERILASAYGENKKEEYLTRNIHHVLVYPCLSIQSPLQQLRAIRPIAPDRTLSEIWHFRLKGVPEAIYRRSLWYYNLVNSPATMVNADDLENWQKGQWGLASQGGEWVSFHRDYGRDKEDAGMLRSSNGCSEMPMRAQFKAWLKYMTAGE